jgi:hypothetical protein
MVLVLFVALARVRLISDGTSSPDMESDRDLTLAPVFPPPPRDLNAEVNRLEKARNLPVPDDLVPFWPFWPFWSSPMSCSSWFWFSLSAARIDFVSGVEVIFSPWVRQSGTPFGV